MLGIMPNLNMGSDRRRAMHKFLDFVQEMAAGGQSVHKNLKSVQEMMV